MYNRNMVTKSLIDITNNARLMEKANKEKEHAVPVPKPTGPEPTHFKPTTAEKTPSPAQVTVEESNEISNLVESVEPSKQNETLNVEQEAEVSVEASLNNLATSKSILEPGGESVALSEESRLRQMVDMSGNAMGNMESDDNDQIGGPRSVYNDMNFDDMSMEIGKGQLEETKLDKTLEENESESEEEGEEEIGEEDGTKKSREFKSPKQKRVNRRTTNVTFAKEDNEEVDETINADPTKNLNKRARTMVSLLSKSFSKSDNAGFFELTRKNGRKQLVQKFYSLLVLTKYEIIEVSQHEQYGDVIITKGDKFDSIWNNFRFWSWTKRKKSVHFIKKI